MHRRPSPAAIGGVSAVPGRGPGRRRLIIVAGLLLLLAPGVGACMPQATSGSLQPTLSLQNSGGATVAMESGIPVPSFDTQPRATIDLAGPWNVERSDLDSDLSLTDRRTALAKIESEAAGRQTTSYADATWSKVEVPGSVNPPPDRGTASAWYRRHFTVPATWKNKAATLKFGAANYVADVWLNGHYLGYHEGGFTPFAFDATAAIAPGRENVLAVRVDAPDWGTRDDIVPWGLADWWNYGGLTQDVWLEMTPPLLVDRADVVPHLDGADVSVTVERRAIPGAASTKPVHGRVEVEILPAHISATNLLDPRAWSLLADGAAPLGSKTFDDVALSERGVAVLQASFAIDGANLWAIGRPSLYVLAATIRADDGSTDLFYTTFGLRHVAVDKEGPRVLLNGAPAYFTGASVHAEQIVATSGKGPYAVPLSTPVQASRQLEEARRIKATLLRTAHQPAAPAVLMLADRLGEAVWEEIPLYHFTPRTFQTTLDRGIPQQMLREMALRDMNRPSVLFYGLANESTGTNERTAALAELQSVAHEIDGTRLTGQAAYGFDPSDPTSDPLDVAGFTFYYGVFYGDDAAAGTAKALAAAHARYPAKPLMVLEFGRWADPPDGLAAQTRILEQTQEAVDAVSVGRSGGYVAGSVWWSLDDYFTMRPGINVERFGMFDPKGTRRPVAATAERMFGAALAENPPALSETIVEHVPVQAARVVESSGSTLRLVGLVAYGLSTAAVMLAALLAVSLTLHRRWSWPLRHGTGPRRSP